MGIFDDNIICDISQDDLNEKGFTQISISKNVFVYSAPNAAAKYNFSTKELVLVLRDRMELCSAVFKALNISNITYPWRRIDKSSIKYETYIQDQYLFNVIWGDFQKLSNHLCKIRQTWINY